MSSLLFARRAAICFCWGLALGIPAAVFAQTNYYTTNGTEYAIIGSLPGDQVFPDVALNSSGGFVVWQDNVTDGSGWGISATRLGPGLSSSLTWWDKKVNIQTNDQENPRVAMLKNGGAVFAWQGGTKGHQHIFARFLSPTNTFLTTTDVVVSTFASNFQINPAVAVLNNSNVVVVWSSFDQASSNSLLDVYGQILSKTNGTKIGTNFLINQFTNYNQRSPAIAALKNGGFVVAWVSEQERAAYNYSGFNNTNGTSPNHRSVCPVWTFTRGFTRATALPTAMNFWWTRISIPCANPAVAAAADGSFMVAWGAKDMVVTDNSWDIYARSFTNASGGPVVRVNSHVYGDQYAPRISAIGGDYMIVWTSLGQDGSREGVFGQFVHEDGSLVGGEFRVNTTTIGQQMQPAVASDGANQFLVVWTGYTVSPNSFDLFAQRYINVAAILQPMDAPFVYAPFVVVSNACISRSCRFRGRCAVGNFHFQLRSLCGRRGTPTALTTSNIWTMTAANGLTTNSTHSFQLDYVTTDGRRSPIFAVGQRDDVDWVNWGPRRPFRMNG